MPAMLSCGWSPVPVLMLMLSVAIPPSSVTLWLAAAQPATDQHDRLCLHAQAHPGTICPMQHRKQNGSPSHDQGGPEGDRLNSCNTDTAGVVFGDAAMPVVPDVVTPDLIRVATVTESARLLDAPPFRIPRPPRI